MKKTWTALKPILCRLWSNFTRSGEQKGDSTSLLGRDEWVFKFAKSEADDIKYAIYALDKGDFDNMGKHLPPGTGRDTGLLTAPSDEAAFELSTGELTRKSQEETPDTAGNKVPKGKKGKLINPSSAAKNERRKRVHQDGEEDEQQEDQDERFLQQQEKHAQSSLELEACKTIYDIGGPEHKALAYDKILKMARLVMTTP